MPTPRRIGDLERKRERYATDPEYRHGKLTYEASRWPERRVPYNATRRRRIADRTAWIRSLKSGPCADCGGTFHPAAMDWDHVLGEKLFQVSAGSKRTRAAVLAEIAKCDLVCANCHRVRTFNRSTAA